MLQRYSEAIALALGARDELSKMGKKIPNNHFK
jgi:hypothetical protein